MDSSANDAQPVRPTGMRPFFVVWAGQACSLLGSQLVQFALIWWLTDNTGSATVLAMASLVGLLPQIIGGPFAGALVDRWNRRLVLIVADGAIALATALLALLYGLGVVQVWHIYALLFVRAAGGAFHWPAMQASTTLMVPKQHLSRVAGMNQTLSGLAFILIPPLGAMAIEVLPMQGILAIDVATALLAIVALLFVSIPQPVRQVSRETRPSVLADLREGFRFVWGWKGLMLFVAIGTLINLLGRATASLIPILVTQHLGGGVLEFGLLQSAIGLGAILGGVTLGIWGGFKRRVVTSLLALALDGIGILVVGLSPRGAFALVAGAILVIGFLETLALGINGAVGQAIIPPEMQGRVFALLMTMSQIATPLGLAIAGPVSDALGVQFWWLLTGITITTVCVAAFFVPDIMHIEDRAQPVAAEG
jgi:DHA3 family macrolide efflux protein-like MFS transporter